jgi:hypothetical protein
MKKNTRKRFVHSRIDENTLIRLAAEAEVKKTTISTIIYQAIRKHVPIV